MTTKIEDGFRKEQQAREQAQKELMAELENEANARQMVQNDLQAIKDKIRQLESGSCSGSTVGSDVSTAVGRGPSGTFARPPQGLAVRLSDLFMPRRMEFLKLGHRLQAVQVPKAYRQRGFESHQRSLPDCT